MKALICEMCGSQEVIKQDGLFVCQSCGTKYSVEEAKRMMIEGTVDVSGSTVKVDNSAFVEKSLANARRAKQKEDWEETEKYYNLVEQNDPTNIEAIFYSAYGKTKMTLVDSNLYKRQAAFNVLQKCVSILDDNFDIGKETEERKIIKQISDDIIAMAGSSYVYNTKKDQNGFVTWDDKSETVSLFNKLGLEFIATLDNIAQKVIDASLKKFYYELGLKHGEYILNNGSLANPQIIADNVMRHHQLIHEIDPSHVVPEKVEAPKKSGCYVATAVYGSYDCPQVWTLRRFRDYMLAKTWYGRTFIHIYYAVSPQFVKWFGQSIWFRNLWKPTLDKLVVRLHGQGVVDTPYQDKNW